MGKEVIPIKVSYNCAKCPGFCCNYDHIPVNNRDVKRLARHFGITETQARNRFTKKVDEDGRGMRHQKDKIYTTICMMFDRKKRQCTIYDARPQVCRAYPGVRKCGYYEFLKFERDIQQDETFVPDA
jgi:Fe-S-cluster containining protein